ncbi:MAG: DUF1223 domain-containing protein [Bacteroidetes bacterium]|nr:MAG: DUF1223 domain-containing protein [Bacteroidota bacterium]
MKYKKVLAVFNLLLFGVVVLIAALKAAPRPDLLHGTFSPVVIMELFTSQGCSSCPPADDLLGKYALKMDKQIIPFAYHVDYWDHLGWKDPFSSSVFSNIQKNYGKHFKLESIYTPQLVINGKIEMVGSDASSISKTLNQELKIPSTVEVRGNFNLSTDHKLNVHYSLDGQSPDQQVNVAVIEKDVRTKVQAGENGGHTLENFNVVRSFTTTHGQLNKEGDLSVEVPKDLEAANMKIVLFVQDKSSLRILGGAVIN